MELTVAVVAAVNEPEDVGAVGDEDEDEDEAEQPRPIASIRITGDSRSPAGEVSTFIERV